MSPDKSQEQTTKVLHVTPWWPHENFPQEGIFIARHVESLAPEFENLVLHICLRNGNPQFSSKREGDLLALSIAFPKLSGRIAELVGALALLLALIKLCAWRFDAINFHTTYPLALSADLIGTCFRVPTLITEHSSRYHFAVEKGSHKGWRSWHWRRILGRGIPIIAVSKRLGADIEEFAGHRLKNISVIPNVVDERLFHYKSKDKTITQKFSMVSHWRPIKSPVAVIRAVAQLLREGHNLALRIGGSDHTDGGIQALIEELGVQDKIEFLGALSPDLVAKEFQSADAVIHISEYETFSVVVAEALACGTPVIASDVGAIPELIDESNGVLVSFNDDIQDWTSSIEGFLEKNYDHKRISSQALQKYSRETVGQLYAQQLSSVREKKKQ